MYNREQLYYKTHRQYTKSHYPFVCNFTYEYYI